MACSVPAVLAVVAEDDVRGLVLEWVDEGRIDAGGEERLGAGLARIHAAGAPRFGALPPGAPAVPLRFGGVELAAGAVAADAPWSEHYAARIAELAAEAERLRRLDPGGATAIAAAVARLPELAGPPEQPARVHGDLWSGNVLAGPDGRPWLIDPAAHGGHREIDLAMLRLFGSVSSRTLAAYEEVAPLARRPRGARPALAAAAAARPRDPLRWLLRRRRRARRGPLRLSLLRLPSSR